MKSVILATCVALAVVGCADRDAPAPSVTQTAEPADAISPKLMIALSRAKNFYHLAKVYMSDGNVAAATASVREILSLEFPPGAPEAEDVRNDARALLAKILLGQGQLEDAMRVVQEGIAASQRESFFVANLYTVKGEIHEARAAAGDGQRAIDEKHAAIEAYTKSNDIDVRIQKQLAEERK
jgi:tetratricopeptide (TPR) repeat protein